MKSLKEMSLKALAIKFLSKDRCNKIALVMVIVALLPVDSPWKFYVVIILTLVQILNLLTVIQLLQDEINKQ